MNPIRKTGRRHLARVWTAALASAGLTLLLFHAHRSWFPDGRLLSHMPLLLFLAWLPLACHAWSRASAEQGTTTLRSLASRVFKQPDIPLWLLLAGLLALLFSNAPQHPWFYYFNWFRPHDNPRLLKAGIERLVWLTLLLAPFLVALRRRRLTDLLLALLLGMQFVAYLSLWRYTDGLALYRDDHPSFMFRLYEYTRTFPAMTVFNPWWNAGVVNSVGASSGVGALALPFFPLWRQLDIHAVYTPIVGAIFTLLMPWLAAASLRAMRANGTACAVAGLIALGVSRYFFVWTLHFGTVGSSTAMLFLLPVTALTYRILVLRRDSPATLAAWGLGLFLLLQWPPCLLMAAFLLPGWLWNVRRTRRRQVLRLLIVGLGVALSMLPNLLAIAGDGHLLDFVLHRPRTGGAGGGGIHLPPWSEWQSMFLQTWGKRLVEAHPLLVYFGIGGVLVIPWRRARRWFAPPIFLLLLTAAWGPILLPKMQLERMAIPALLLALAPAALCIARLLRRGGAGAAIVRPLLVALLLLGGLTVREIYRGRGYAPFESMPCSIQRMAQWIRQTVPADGRLLFVGKNVHAFGHGHIAYLPILAQREMMACDYYAFPVGMVEYDYPPRPWRADAAGIAAFMRLHGATHATAYHPDRQAMLRDAPEWFAEVPDPLECGFKLFALRDPRPGRFHVGQGQIEADSGLLKIATDGPAEVVLRYNWHPGLRASGGAKLYPHPVTNDIVFIGLQTPSDRPVTLRYRGSPAK